MVIRFSSKFFPMYSDQAPVGFEGLLNNRRSSFIGFEKVEHDLSLRTDSIYPTGT